jgi:F0F1-type ATP synthase assembly protein I
MDRLHTLARRTDDLAFDLVFQPLVDRVWRAPPGSLAQLALGGSVGLVLVRALVVHHEGRFGGQQAIGASLAVAFGNMLFSAMLWHEPAPFGRNPRRVNASYLMARMFGLVVLLLLPVAMAPWVPWLGFEYWIALAGNALGVASLYLEGCDWPPPPGCQSAHLTGLGRAGSGGSGRTGG